MSESHYVLPPPEVVRKMLYREIGSAGDRFTRLLLQAEIGPRTFDEMLEAAWAKMVKLPFPPTLNYVTQDLAVQKVIMDAASTSAENVQKGMRV